VIAVVITSYALSRLLLRGEKSEAAGQK
jgi:hypothetical protein